MEDLILKKHGADATGIISEREDVRWHAHLLVRDHSKAKEQTRGPESFPSEDRARQWLLHQAASHGFKEEDFEITVEKME